MTEIIYIDGSFGEGGGQVLRSALALSLVTGKAFRIDKIRAGRKKPGLMRQHLTAVNAAVEIGGAVVHGNDIGSKYLEFIPSTVKPGVYSFAVGTAGSCTLVLQTILPALLTASGRSELRLEGGTHNPFAPPYDFLAEAFLPLVDRMGPTITAKLERPGFYPAGGGCFRVTIEPVRALKSLEILDRGRIIKTEARALIAKLSKSIAERELKAVGSKLGWTRELLHVEEVEKTRGPGNVVLIEVQAENIAEVFTGFGMKGVSAEAVGKQAANAAAAWLEAEVPVGPYLADQLLIPMAIAGYGKFRTLPLTKHTMTNIDVIKKFLNVGIEISVSEDAVREVTVRTRE